MLHISHSLPKDLRLKINDMLNLKLLANKKLGQNFLSDVQICDKIVLSCGDLKNSFVLEIGPGIGHLTQSILALNEGVNIIAIEADSRFIPVLNEVSKYYKTSKCSIINSDALKCDFQSIITNNTRKNKQIIANLPYNIGTELLFKWLQKDFLCNINRITVMLQKEVVNRIIAKPCTKSYSWLSILSQLLCDVDVLFDVPNDAFTPIPKVVSSVVILKPKTHVLLHDIIKLKRLCQGLFLHRRKTVYTTIKHNKDFHYLLPILEKYGITHTTRAEEISIETFCQLSTI